MQEHDRGDGREQESVAARVKQRPCGEKRAQAGGCEQKPRQELVRRALSCDQFPANQVIAQIGDVGVKQRAVPGDRVEYADREENRGRGEDEADLPSGQEKRGSQNHKRKRRVLDAHGRRQDSEDRRRDFPFPRRLLPGLPEAERERGHQQGRGRELGHRLVGEGDQLVPERAGHKRDPGRRFAEMPPREKVHSRRNQKRHGAEKKLYSSDIPDGFPETCGVKQLHDSGDRPGHQPRAGAVEVFPVAYAVSEDEPVGGLEVLHDFVRVQDEVARKRHGRARGETEREHKRQVFPGRPPRVPWVEQGGEQAPQRVFSVFLCHLVRGSGGNCRGPGSAGIIRPPPRFPPFLSL